VVSLGSATFARRTKCNGRPIMGRYLPPTNPRDRRTQSGVVLHTPVESPESNGMAEAFVKTFKRDYMRMDPIPDDARFALTLSILDGGLQLRTPPFPSRLSLTAGVHLLNFNKLRVRSHVSTLDRITTGCRDPVCPIIGRN